MDESTGEKSILIRGYRVRVDAYGHRRTEVWFIVKHTAGGSTQVGQIFKELTARRHEFDFAKSSCALIGSTLYVLGGQFSNRDSDHIFRLDSQDPTAGWKECGRLPYPCPASVVGAAGNLIYLFPQRFDRRFTWGCVYDTVTKESKKMEPPPTCCFDCKFSSFILLDPVFCAAFDDGPENRGVLVSRSDGGHIYLYNPDKDSWKFCCNYKFFDPSSASLSLPQHAVLNGKLYLSYCKMECKQPTVLYAYEIHTGQHIGKFKVPKFEMLNPLSDTKPFLVAIGDYKLCYLWHRRLGCNINTLCVAKVVLSPDTGIVTIVSEDDFDVNAEDFENFIPCAGMEQIKVEEDVETCDEKLWFQQAREIKRDQSYRARKRKELEDLQAELKYLLAKMEKKAEDA